LLKLPLLRAKKCSATRKVSSAHASNKRDILFQRRIFYDANRDKIVGL
jgi:hypothetical protein